MAHAGSATTPFSLAQAGRLLGSRGMLGLAWAGADLFIRGREGELAEFVEVGQPITMSLLPLFGQEAQLRALRDDPTASLDVTNVSIQHAGGMTPKLNISAIWVEAANCYIFILTRIIARTDAEIELARQIRLRTIAEALVAEKTREVERSNAELVRANRDLDEFAYVVSHDLKAPLRAMRFIAEDIGRAIEHGAGDAAELLQQMREQTRRMSGMLTGLLEYARAGQKERLIERIHTGELVRSIVASMPHDGGPAVEISGQWPMVDTLAAPLDLVLRNLVDNAIKHHDRPGGVVKVTCRPAADRLLIEVSDDGPGIDPAYHGDVFRPFVKLGSGTAVESSGMGLAIVRKSIEANGGSIELVSDPARSRGTTFRIEWPVMPSP